jgi:Leucine-rich repeat (LRR) protein
MRNMIVVFLVLVITGFVFAESQPIEFADERLENAIRTIIEKPEGLIYSEDVIDIARIKASVLQSSSLKGIEYCVNLIYLRSGSGKISDISALRELVRLETLRLHDNQISDISDLSGLVNLKELHLEANSIRDISPIAKLKSLEIFDLSSNKRRLLDVSVLLKLPNLKKVDVSGSLIEDKSALDILEERGVDVRR